MTITPGEGQAEAEVPRVPHDLERPRAFGGWRRSIRLAWVLAKTEFRQRYANALLGYLWTILEPLLLWATLYFVLDRVLLFGDQIEHYAAFLLMNVVLYDFYREASTRSYKTIRTKGGRLMRKISFSRAVLPLSTVMATGIAYAPMIPGTYIFLLVTGVEPSWTWALFPVILVWLVTFTLGTAFLLAAIYSKIADLDHVWRSLVRMQFFLTPVFYSVATLPPLRLSGLVLVNPLTLILSQAQLWMIDPQAPGMVEAAGGMGPVWIAIGITVAVCVIGPLAFARIAPSAAERL